MDILLLVALGYLAVTRMYKRMREAMRRYFASRASSIMSEWNFLALQVGYLSGDSLIKFYATLSEETLFLDPLDANIYALPDYHGSFLVSPKTVSLDNCPLDIRSRSNAGHNAIRNALREFGKLPAALYKERIHALSSTEREQGFTFNAHNDVRRFIYNGQEELLALFFLGRILTSSYKLH